MRPPQETARQNLETRRNTLLNGRVTLHQPNYGYRSAIDPVFLAAATNPQPGQRILDAGCGVGTAGLCLLTRARNLDLRLIGIDIQPELVKLARQNADENGFNKQALFFTGDIKSPPDEIKQQKGMFDCIIINPPYLEAASHTPSKNIIQSTANASTTATLTDWIGFSQFILRPKGRLTMVHRADRLPEILSCLYSDFGDIAVYPLWPRKNKPAKRVLIGAVYKSKAPATMYHGMVLHCDESHAYTRPAYEILYNASGIDLWP